MFEEMDFRKIGIMNRRLQQKIGRKKIGSTGFAEIIEIGTDPILDRYIGTSLVDTSTDTHAQQQKWDRS